MHSRSLSHETSKAPCRLQVATIISAAGCCRQMAGPSQILKRFRRRRQQLAATDVQERDEAEVDDLQEQQGRR